MSILEHGVGETADRMIATARRNPEGVLLLAAGVALLMRGVGAATRSLQEDGTRSRTRNPNGADDDEAGRFVDDGISYAADMAARVRRSAGDLASSTSRRATEVYDDAGHMLDDASSAVGQTVSRLANEQPLAIALFGLAAGALVAGMVPPVAAEKRVLRPVGRRLHDGVDEAAGRLKNSTRQAGKRLREVADERGFNKRGLKEAVDDVTSAFSDGMAAAEPKKPRTRQRRASSSPPASRSGSVERDRGPGVQSGSGSGEAADAVRGQSDEN